MKEELLQFIWENNLFDHRDLVTSDGESLSILETGVMQHGQGPDLDNAKIRIGEQLWGGTVEVHKKASEWYAHGHHTDNRYENVVLHVVLQNDKPARTISERLVPTVELDGRINELLIDRYDEWMSRRNWIPCDPQFTSVPSRLIDDWLEELLIQRLERRSKAIVEFLNQTKNNENEVLYRLIVRALGQKVNSQGFEQLARAAPIRKLRRYHNDVFRLEALLLGLGGFLHETTSKYGAQAAQEFEALVRVLGLVPISQTVWKFGRVRPNAFPTVRIALLASLIHELGGDFTQLLNGRDADAMVASIQVSASANWNNRFTLPDSNPGRTKSIGRALARDIIVDAVIPFLYTLGKVRKETKLINRSLLLLQQIPSASNEIIRGWRERGIICESMAHSQGLLELKNGFCDKQKCLDCRIGNAILKQECL